ncbi:MAG: MG2 domain-containing protein, partial [Paracoccaceae bacterium]
MAIFRNFLVMLICLLAGPAPLQAQVLTPERRLVLQSDVDFAGNDLQALYDTTLDQCEASCLANPACQAITYNQRSNACFIKSGAGEPAVFVGALSGLVLSADPTLADGARQRRAELSMLQEEDFAQALAQAQGLANAHLVGDQSADDLLTAGLQARNRGDLQAALRYQGAALNLTDAADQWVDYGDLALSLAASSADQQSHYRWLALSASINGYLRAGDGVAMRATALITMARALETVGRGSEMIGALQLAQELAPRDDTAAMLDQAIGKYGFNISEHRVDSDQAEPRICAIFNQPLIAAGTDYAPFVALPVAGMAVSSTDNQICISGLQHAERYQITFRRGLPAASGEKLAKDITLLAYVRDRTPAVRFPGRTYVLPETAEGGIPVETVNLARLNLTLYRLSDRNLVQAFRDDFVARPLDFWSMDYFNSQFTEKVWQGSADLAPAESNRDTTTRLPMAEALAGLGPGIYVLGAEAPDSDPDQVPPAQQWFVISDLGLATLQGVDGLHVFVRGLSDAAARAGVTVSLINRANSVIASAETDDQGYALFAPALLAGQGNAAPALVTLTLGDDFAFLSLTEPEFDLSDRGVSGQPAAPAIDVFMATDRGAYRAGEVVNATILARDPSMRAIEGLALTARLLRPDGVEYARTIAADAGAGGRAVAFAIGATAPRGTWRLEVFAEAESRTLASSAFLVEDFLPERIDFTLGLPDQPLVTGQETTIALTARYLFGAAAADLPIEGNMILTAADKLPNLPGYHFGRYDDPFPTYFDPIGAEYRTVADGTARINVTLPDPGPAGERPLRALFALRMAEGSGRPVERTVERLMLPRAAVIGIRPAFQGDVAEEAAGAQFDLIAIGPDGAPVAAKARWALNRLETRYQWYTLYGQSNWDVTTTRSEVASGMADLRADGAANIIAPVEWGNYELVVENADHPAASASYAFYAGGFASADAVRTPDALAVTLDKPAYRPGDTAHLRLVAAAPGVG